MSDAILHMDIWGLPAIYEIQRIELNHLYFTLLKRVYRCTGKTLSSQASMMKKPLMIFVTHVFEIEASIQLLEYLFTEELVCFAMFPESFRENNGPSATDWGAEGGCWRWIN